MRLLRILDEFPPSMHGIDGLAKYALKVVKSHIRRFNGQKSALLLVSLGPYRSFLDIKAFVSEDIHIKFLVKYNKDAKVGWVPELTEVESEDIEEKFPEFDVIHSERPKGPWQPA
ncbi:hypothetical protein TWF173_005977 [Orbilia oligospora]|nr:hypothetical protein TWF173_005977 [Orbilia oligospora]